jgi:MSHA biogenesis protein MshP
MNNRQPAQRGQRGFLVIAGIFLVVVLAGLLAYLGSVSNTTQTASVADLNSARAYQAARAGAEWAMYSMLQGPATAGTFRNSCESSSSASPAKKSLTFGSTLASFTATVTCYTSTFTEGGASGVIVYSIVSNACNLPSGGNCPNAAATSSLYVEREISVSITN